MKPVLAYIRTHRWCRLLIVGIALCALPMLHPLVRQSLFGPTIDGIPWCVWEEEVYAEADRGGWESWSYKILKKVGLVREARVGLPPRTTAGLPIWIHLAEDRNERVRRLALWTLSSMAQDHPEVLPVLRRHLQDDEPECRLIAVNALWRQTKDLDLKPVVVPLLQHTDWRVRAIAVSVLGEMVEKAPDLFATLVMMNDDPHTQVRRDVVLSMRCCGARGVPILAKALRDPDLSIRRCALWAMPKADLSKPLEPSPLEKDYEPLVPMLIALKNDRDLDVVRDAAHALYILNPKRFAKPATWQDD